MNWQRQGLGRRTLRGVEARVASRGIARKAASGRNPTRCGVPSVRLRLAPGPSALLCLGVLRTRSPD